jgi:phosphate transport system permease protein
MEVKMSRDRRIKDFALKLAVYLSGAVVCIVLLALIGCVFYNGFPFITSEFLTTQSSYIHDTIGILPNILNTLYIVFIAMVIVIPLGVCAAVYLNEYATNHRFVRIIGFAVETLTGIPSVVFGLVGMLFFIQLLGLQAGVLAGGLTLVVMVLPTIISNTLESLKSVPSAYREGALALGSGKWHMVRTVVLPNAIDGIVTGCILAIGRIVGESAALLYTAGFGLILNSFMTALQSSSATLTVALYVYATERGELNVAFAVATILMLITLILNFAANLSASKLGHKGERA